MVKKKKLSGQTVVIIILAILLLLTIGFGGVFAYYSARSNKVSGKIVMANLKISLESGTGESDKSEIVISNGVNVVPGQPLENSPLIIRNLSTVSIYLIVVYEINAFKPDKTEISDDYIDPVLGLGVEYINPIHSEANDNIGVNNPVWIDYVFKAEAENKLYRCLVSMTDFAPTAENENGITIIGENKLSLAGAMGNDYQNTSISFTFQAYAIGSATDFGLSSNPSKQEKCEKIVSTIYKAQDKTFLNINVTK